MLLIKKNNYWQGALWKIVSCACFAGINGIVRYISKNNIGEEALPANVIMFYQNLFGAIFLLPWMIATKQVSLSSNYKVLQVLRILSAVLGVYLWYLSLKYMPIAESLALTFTGPIFTVIGASLLLQENISKKRYLAILFSILGAFIISRPDLAFSEDSQSMGLLVLFPLSSALVLAVNKLLTRKLAYAGESPVVLTAYLLFFMAPVSLVFAMHEWVDPSLAHFPWLIILGFLTAIAHFSFSKAYQLAEVTFLMPIGFIKFFLSTLIGYLAFAEIPYNPSSWIGMIIIFFSILLLEDSISLRSWIKLTN